MCPWWEVPKNIAKVHTDPMLSRHEYIGLFRRPKKRKIRILRDESWKCLSGDTVASETHYPIPRETQRESTSCVEMIRGNDDDRRGLGIPTCEVSIKLIESPLGDTVMWDDGEVGW